MISLFYTVSFRIKSQDWDAVSRPLLLTRACHVVCVHLTTTVTFTYLLIHRIKVTVTPSQRFVTSFILTIAIDGSTINKWVVASFCRKSNFSFRTSQLLQLVEKTPYVHGVKRTVVAHCRQLLALLKSIWVIASIAMLHRLFDRIFCYKQGWQHREIAEWMQSPSILIGSAN